jgi:hypothetical protein
LREVAQFVPLDRILIETDLIFPVPVPRQNQQHRMCRLSQANCHAQGTERGICGSGNERELRCAVHCGRQPKPGVRDHETLEKSLEQNALAVVLLIFCLTLVAHAGVFTNFAAVLRDNPGNLQSL